MKSNINQKPLRVYSQIPKSWHTRPNMANYHLADESVHTEDGWRDVVVPVLLDNEYLGELFYSDFTDVVSYRVKRFTPQEISEKILQDAESKKYEAMQQLQEKQLLATANAITDQTQLIEIKDVFPIWERLEDGYQFRVNEKYQAIDADGLSLYRVIQAHAKQITWHPNVTPALWTKIVIQNGVEVWSQPIGGDGKYPYIDPKTNQPYRVSHKGQTWVNGFQGGLNVWEPSVFGWTLA